MIYFLLEWVVLTKHINPPHTLSNAVKYLHKLYVCDHQAQHIHIKKEQHLRAQLLQIRFAT